MGNSGKVLMIFKGDYNASTTYQKLNVVYYNNRSYVCKQTSTGNAPTNTTYWQALTGDASAEIQALTNYVAEKNVKNILPENIATQTNRGVTFTVNSDGSITLSGTCNETASVTIAKSFPIKAGDYVYSKGATTGSAIMYLYDTTTFAEIASTADHVEFNIASDRQIMARFYIINGTTYNATVYPMIVAKSVYDADPTYQPYAKTNVELTQLGVYYHTSNDSISLPTGTEPEIINISNLPAGVYIVSAMVRGYPNTECDKYARVLSSNDSNIARIQGVSKIEDISIFAVVNIPVNNGTISIKAYQNSGSTVTLNARLDIVRVG